MFRPFLPCGIAYGFAYALPMLCLWLCLWHSMLFFRRKASRRVVCIVPYRRGACQPVSAEFRRHLPFSGAGGCPRVGGGIAPALQARRALAAPYGAEPQRHLFTLPRGRGPSQTPPSLATDSSISPGPPSPWLPALSPVNKQEPLVVQVPSLAQARGCKGRSPLHKKTKNLPLPAGKGGGGMGAESKLKAGAAGDKQGKPPLRIPERQGQPTTSRASPPITPAPHMPPAGRRQCGQNPAGRRDSHRTPARPRRRKWHAERYREHG